MLRSLTKRKKVVYRSDELLIHVVIASDCLLQLVDDQHKVFELPVTVSEETPRL